MALAALFAFTVALDAQEITDRASYRINQNRALWYNTSNAAGLARDGMLQWRDVSVGYGLQSGSFADSWSAGTVSGFNTNGDMLMDIEGFKVAAALSFEHDVLSNCRYNASLYEVNWDMPFFVAMNTTDPFSWRHNDAKLDVSAATPLLIDGMLSAGLALHLQKRNAAKSGDPLCNYNSMEISLAPSVTYSVNEDNILGLTLHYNTTPATSELASASGSTIDVAFLRGLGEFTPRNAGGVIGMEPVEYQASHYGANIQYNLHRDNASWLVEVLLDKGTTAVAEQTKALGSVDKFVTGLAVQGLWGGTRSRKLTLGLDYNLNYWLTGQQTTMGRCNIVDAKLDYTVYTEAGSDGYNFELGAGMDFTSLSIMRFNPDGQLYNISLLPYAFLGKNTRLGKESALLVRLDAGYNFSSDTSYDYAGSWSSVIVNYMYDDEADYLARYYVMLKADAQYSYRINSLLAAYARADARLLKPMGTDGSRVIAGLSVGILF